MTGDKCGESAARRAILVDKAEVIIDIEIKKELKSAFPRGGASEHPALRLK